MTRPKKSLNANNNQSSLSDTSALHSSLSTLHPNNFIFDDASFVNNFGISAGSPGPGVNQYDPYSHRLRRYYRRPDRHPFIIDIPGSIFFPSRSLPTPCTKYPIVIGEVFWRVAAYLDSIPVRVEDRRDGRRPPPHLIISGIPGSGKSYIMAAASALLGLSDRVIHPDDNVDDDDDGNNFPNLQRASPGQSHRAVFIGDCQRWIDAEDPLQYFCMELLSAFRADSLLEADVDLEEHHDPSHIGCMSCIEPFTRLEQVQLYLDRIYTWIKEYKPNTLFTIFIDQAEALSTNPDSIPTRIVAMLLHAKLPILVFSVTSSAVETFPFRTNCATTIAVPFRMSLAEFTKQIEIVGATSEEWFLARDFSLLKDIRAWTGGVPGELSRLFRQANNSLILSRLEAYQRAVLGRIQKLISGKKFEPQQRNTLLVTLFAMILRVPLDWTENLDLVELRELDGDISNLLLANCFQSFYHPIEGTVAVRTIPTAISFAVHLGFSHPSILQSIAKSWEHFFERIVSAMVNSTRLCNEAKRRFSRFYAHAKFYWHQSGKHDKFKFGCKNELGEDVMIQFERPRLVFFASQTPALIHFDSLSGGRVGGGGEGEGRNLSKDGSDHDAIVFLPSSSRYWFFDFFVLIPDERKLFAVTTAPIVGSWLKELSTRVGPMQLQQHRDDGLQTPLILLENWKETLKKAGLHKVAIKCCIIRPLDLMNGMSTLNLLNDNEPTSQQHCTNKEDELVTQLECTSLDQE